MNGGCKCGTCTEALEPLGRQIWDPISSLGKVLAHVATPRDHHLEVYYLQLPCEHLCQRECCASTHRCEREELQGSDKQSYAKSCSVSHTSFAPKKRGQKARVKRK